MCILRLVLKGVVRAQRVAVEDVCKRIRACARVPCVSSRLQTLC